MVAANAEVKRQPAVDFERQLAQQETLYSKLIDAHEQRLKASERDIFAMRQKCNESDAKIQSLTSELSNARAAPSNPSATPELEAQLQKQQIRIEELEGIVTDLSRRSSTLFQRYQDGSLVSAGRSHPRSFVQRSLGRFRETFCRSIATAGP